MAELPIKPIPSQERLKELFDYSPETGLLSWRSLKKPRLGCVSSHGYLRVKIGRRVYSVHRVIWKMVTGHEPPSIIDHIDGDPLNNKISNLRGTDRSGNQQNKRIQINNRSGFKGVSWQSSHKSWQACIMSGGKSHWLGRYKNIDDAVKVVSEARNRLHGEFARGA
jgi:hypothetical protein